MRRSNAGSGTSSQTRTSAWRSRSSGGSRAGREPVGRGSYSYLRLPPPRRASPDETKASVRGSCASSSPGSPRHPARPSKIELTARTPSTPAPAMAKLTRGLKIAVIAPPSRNPSPGLGFLLGGAITAIFNPRVSFAIAGAGVLGVLAVSSILLGRAGWRGEPGEEAAHEPRTEALASPGDARLGGGSRKYE